MAARWHPQGAVQDRHDTVCDRAGGTPYVMQAETPGVIRFGIRGPIARGDLAGLCDRVCALLERSGGAVIAVCDVSGVDPDAVTVDALARLQLGARRHGCQVRLRGASAELRAFVAFMGLRDVLPD